MQLGALVCCFFLLACGPTPKETIVTTTKTEQPPTGAELTTLDTDTGFTGEVEAPVVFNTKSPSGIYQFVLPYGASGVLHTVGFNPGKYRLQEEYGAARDSLVISQGTWAPSAGFIWLYKDQIVRGRYAWKGDSLQYYSPRLKKFFTLTKLTPAENNTEWRKKAQAGAALFSVGTEPFWSLEVSKKDSIVINVPDWTQPLKVRIGRRVMGSDSTVYFSQSDSVRIVVYPQFCNDGMSDFIYTSKVRFTYRQTAYEGCGVVF